MARTRQPARKTTGGKAPRMPSTLPAASAVDDDRPRDSAAGTSGWRDHAYPTAYGEGYSPPSPQGPQWPSGINNDWPPPSGSRAQICLKSPDAPTPNDSERDAHTVSGPWSPIRPSRTIPEKKIFYSSAADTWGGDSVKVFDTTGQLLITVPRAFLGQGLRQHPVSALENFVKACFYEPGDILDAGQSNHGGFGVRIGAHLTFTRDDGQSDEPCTPKKGPRGPDLSQPPPNDDDNVAWFTTGTSVRSLSVERGALGRINASILSKFRTNLIARDSQCLLTDAECTDCAPCHILPLDRPEYYQEVLGWGLDGNIFKPEYALLLRTDMKIAFEQRKWSLFCEGPEYVVHWFDGNHTGSEKYHGKVLEGSTRFRSAAGHHPNRQLLQFHYHQCVMQHFRGYSAGFC
ncbi:hypothetical protein CF319_g1397 [Tilletia indica]|uniref:Uncharacterized protein n=1 Tax=Tilletia indica TaxID=43049 RepID=A0A177T8T2_9BASI|nr:hypothetical protein CF319_g1397 [Tilletia indica]KAE8229334.1 hypothetical protein CF326_g5699 [Tilletia indica]KAE8240383.1 hypothetical protein A4X13_0g7833 [Tilletia indica]